MRKFLVSMMLVTSIAGAASVAVANETAHGSITEIDSKDCTLTLSDSNSAYRFGRNCDFSKLKVGEKVTISWLAAGNVRLAAGVKAD